jgi:hypothetical protein
MHDIDDGGADIRTEQETQQLQELAPYRMA